MTLQIFSPEELKQLYVPPSGSHKGQNGKLLLIGGSHLFHAASLWSLKIASRIVDMVFYASIPENNRIVHEAKKEFRDGIVVPRENVEDYINEADCVLLGPGMVRTEERLHPTEDYMIKNLSELDEIEHEGIQTYYMTKYLLHKYPKKKWVIDGGALQMAEPEWLAGLSQVIITPHHEEFERIKLKSQNAKVKNAIQNSKIEDQVSVFAKEYDCIVLLKGEEDLVCSPKECVRIVGGNAGMTKGGTGDVLAGLVAALACKNDLFLAAKAGSYINKKAGEALFEKVGYTFNSSDLVDEIPALMKKMLDSQ